MHLIQSDQPQSAKEESDSNSVKAHGLKRGSSCNTVENSQERYTIN